MSLRTSALGIGEDQHTKLTERRYAKWARLADQHGSVSKLIFEPPREETADVERPGLSSAKSVRPDLLNMQFDSMHLLKVLPTYAYRNRRMTAMHLYYEMMGTSEKWEDFRGVVVGDRDEERIGSLHVEVLECHGLVRRPLCAPTLCPLSSPHSFFNPPPPPSVINQA